MQHIDKSNVLRQGLVVFIFLAVLTGLEFFIAVAIEDVFLLLIVALIKFSLVLYYYMHIYRLNEPAGEDQHSAGYKTATSRFGLWLFLLSDSFVFGALAA
ncbi:MAG: hypothetical protein ACK2T0_07075, partial [Anaerolineales bacterium]